MDQGNQGKNKSGADLTSTYQVIQQVIGDNECEWMRLSLHRLGFFKARVSVSKVVMVGSWFLPVPWK